MCEPAGAITAIWARGKRGSEDREGRPQRAGFLLALLGIAVICAWPVTAQEVSAEPQLLPLTAKPEGLSYRQWQRKWDQLSAVRRLSSRSSLLTAGANRCGIQVGNARLLPASVTRRATVRCTIPAGSFLVFPVTGWADAKKKRAELRGSMRSGFRMIKRAALTVDGRRVRPPGHILTSPIFRVRLRRGNPLMVPPGRWFSQSRDYFAILSPPPSGEHTIRALGVITPPGQRRFGLGIIYRLTVQPTP